LPKIESKINFSTFASSIALLAAAAALLAAAAHDRKASLHTSYELISGVEARMSQRCVSCSQFSRALCANAENDPLKTKQPTMDTYEIFFNITESPFRFCLISQMQVMTLPFCWFLKADGSSPQFVSFAYCWVGFCFGI
jgi:hypothetical protein